MTSQPVSPHPIFVGSLSVFDCGFAAQCAGAARRAADGPPGPGGQDLDASGQRKAGPVCGQHHRALVLRRPRCEARPDPRPAQGGTQGLWSAEVSSATRRQAGNGRTDAPRLDALRTVPVPP